MGVLKYGDSDVPIDIDDRTLAHLQAVVVAKLRRNESFTLSWRHCPDSGSGRSTIWLHPAIPLLFEFDQGPPDKLNLEWLERLMHSANTSGGIRLIEETSTQE